MQEFAKSLKNLTINACILKEQNSDGWLATQPTDATVFKHLNQFILGFENLESLELIGMSIVDNLHELVMAVRRPKLKKFSIPYNGIEQEYCLYFKDMLNFETLQHLDLSCNWFGMAGLERVKHQFKHFKTLKILNLSNNKLC